MRSALIAILGTLAVIGVAGCGGDASPPPGNPRVEDEEASAATGVGPAPSTSPATAQPTAAPTETHPEVLDGVSEGDAVVIDAISASKPAAGAPPGAAPTMRRMF